MGAVTRDEGERSAVEERLRSELARSSAELEEFVYVASHDLQEPLRAIGSFSNLLAARYRGKLDPQADEFLGYIESGVHRMHGLIQDLLEYSRSSRRREPFVRVSSASALDAALAKLETEVESTKASIERDELPEVVADEQQLAQLFMHLVGNAIKFHGEKQPVVRVGAVREGGSWRFSVKDNGIGIEPRFFERIFVIFQRLHTRDRYPGNGVGLALCRKIVERHGGRLWVESRPGEGSDFRFTLPADAVPGTPA